MTLLSRNDLVTKAREAAQRRMVRNRELLKVAKRGTTGQFQPYGFVKPTGDQRARVMEMLAKTAQREQEGIVQGDAAQQRLAAMQQADTQRIPPDAAR